MHEGKRVLINFSKSVRGTYLRYCIVISIGYGITLTILWNLLVLVGMITNSGLPILQLFGFGLILPLLATSVGILVNCAFETLGAFFSLSPSWAITLGWFTLSLSYTVITLGTTLSSVNNPYSLAWTLITRSTNTVPASNIFYIIGNLTLSWLGWK